jgi:hypothetical protein
MLQKFLKIYTRVVTVAIIICLCSAAYAWFAGQTVYAMPFVFFAVMLAAILWVTRNLIKRNLPGQQRVEKK